MATARTRANRKYNEKTYARISVTIPKGIKQAVEAHAQSKGQSVNGLINALLKADMKLSDAEWNDRPNALTIAAMQEAERIENDPAVKSYTNLDELFAELKA